MNWPSVMAIGALLLVACSGGSSQTEGNSRRDLSNMTVRVVIDLPGDDIGGPESQGMLQGIKDGIQEKNVARVMSSGFGMGTAEVVLKYEGPGSADELGRIIARACPGAKYRLEIGTH